MILEYAKKFDVTVEAWIQGELEPAASTLINENGEFLLFGLNDVQTYDIKFTPAADSGYLVKMVIDIEAAIGTTKDMGTIELDPES